MDGDVDISDDEGALRAAFGESDHEEEGEEEEEEEEEEEDVNELSAKDMDSEDDEFDPQDDPAYRSELDAELVGEEGEEDDPEVYVEDESGARQYDVSDDEDEEDEEDASLYEGENEWVMTMRKRFGLSSRGGSDLFVCGWTDPTFLFLLPTLMSVVFVKGDAATQTLSVVAAADLPQRLMDHVCDPAWAAGALFLYAAYTLAGGAAATKGRFSFAERCAAGWYLWNGCICHLMMDGMAGGPNGGWGLKVMHENYAILDRRFDEASTTAIASDVAVGTVVTQTELVFHAGLCLAAYVGLASRKGWADGVGLVALSFQLFGAFVFILPEFMTGCENMVPHGVKNCMPGFSLFELFYFWFGVGVNVVWVIVPAVMIVNIWRSYA
jgi:hypothetical protein